MTICFSNFFSFYFLFLFLHVHIRGEEGFSDFRFIRHNSSRLNWPLGDNLVSLIKFVDQILIGSSKPLFIFYFILFF
jgi:hypothetical protein